MKESSRFKGILKNTLITISIIWFVIFLVIGGVFGVMLGGSFTVGDLIAVMVMILSPLLALTLFEKSSTGVWKGILIIWLIAMSVVILQMNFYNLFFVSVLSWSGFLKMYTVAYLPLVLIYFIWKFFDKDSNI